MASPRAIARALARGAEKEAVKPRAPKPLTAEEIAAARHVFRAGDDAGLGRNYVRGVMKFTADGMTPEARMARAREMEVDTDTTMYHGTPQGDIPSFEYGRDRDGALLNQELTATQSGRGVSLAFSPEHAAGYATPDHWSILTPQQGRWLAARFLPNNDYEGYQRAQAALIANRLERFSPTVMPLVTVKDRANVTMPKGYAWNTDEGALMDQGLEKARKAGKRAATVRNVTEGDQVAVFDRSAIRSPFATFDPARANRRDLLAGVVPVAAAGGAGALAMQPQEAEAAQPVASPALASALAREAPRFNAALDTSLDVASFFDPTGGYATETARALKDLPAKVGPAGAVALAPLTGATEALGSIGQLPELGVAGGRALARAIARKPAPRGSGTYRKAK